MALTWQYDVPDFDASEDGSASRYLQGLTGKIPNALPDWASSKTNEEVSTDWDDYDDEEPAPPKDHAVGTTAFKPEPEAEPSAIGTLPTVKNGSDSPVCCFLCSEISLITDDSRAA